MGLEACTLASNVCARPHNDTPPLTRPGSTQPHQEVALPRLLTERTLNIEAQTHLPSPHFIVYRRTVFQNRVASQCASHPVLSYLQLVQRIISIQMIPFHYTPRLFAYPSRPYDRCKKLQRVAIVQLRYKVKLPQTPLPLPIHFSARRNKFADSR